MCTVTDLTDGELYSDRGSCQGRSSQWGMEEPLYATVRKRSSPARPMGEAMGPLVGREEREEREGFRPYQPLYSRQHTGPQGYQVRTGRVRKAGGGGW